MGGEVDILRGVEPMSKFNLSLERGIQIKMALMLFTLFMKELAVLKWVGLLVLIVGISTLVSV